MIGVHPRALLEFDGRGCRAAKLTFVKLMKGFDSPREFLRWSTDGRDRDVRRRYRNASSIRLSDFKSAVRQLVGGEQHEPHEENPMLEGFRGAGRYDRRSFRDCFALECEAGGSPMPGKSSGRHQHRKSPSTRSCGRSAGESGHRRAGAGG